MATVRGNLTAWDSFYKTGRWQRLRRLQLRQYPLSAVPSRRRTWWITSPAPGRLECLRLPASLRACASRATSRRSDRSSCAATVPTSGSTACRPTPNHPFNRAR